MNFNTGLSAPSFILNVNGLLKDIITVTLIQNIFKFKGLMNCTDENRLKDLCVYAKILIILSFV